jgi:hypothetical protein
MYSVHTASSAKWPVVCKPQECLLYSHIEILYSRSIEEWNWPLIIWLCSFMGLLHHIKRGLYRRSELAQDGIGEKGGEGMTLIPAAMFPYCILIYDLYGAPPFPHVCGGFPPDSHWSQPLKPSILPPPPPLENFLTVFALVFEWEVRRMWLVGMVLSILHG